MGSPDGTSPATDPKTLDDGKSVNRDHHVAIFGEEEEAAAMEKIFGDDGEDGVVESEMEAGREGGGMVNRVDALFGDEDMSFGDDGAATWSELDAVMGEDGDGGVRDVVANSGEEGGVTMVETVSNVFDDGRDEDKYGSVEETGTELIGGTGIGETNEGATSGMAELVSGTDLWMGGLDGDEAVAEPNQAEEHVDGVGMVEVNQAEKNNVGVDGAGAGMEVDVPELNQAEKYKVGVDGAHMEVEGPEVNQAERHIFDVDAAGVEVDVPDLNQAEKLNVGVEDDGMEVEGADFSPRERKKSKYLSGPYTDSSPVIKSALLADTCSSVPLSPKKGEAKIGPLATYESVDVKEFLSDLHSMAINRFYLKQRRLSEKPLRGFCAEFRWSTYLCLDPEGQKVQRMDVDSSDGGFTDGSKVVKARGKRKRSEAEAPLNLDNGKMKTGSATQRKKVKKNEVDGENQLNVDSGVTDNDKVKNGKPRQTKRVKKNELDRESQLNEDSGLANGSHGKRKVNASATPIQDLSGHDPFAFPEDGVPKKRKSKAAVVNVAPLNSRDPNGLPEGNSFGQNMMTTDSDNGLQLVPVEKTKSASRGATSRQKQKIVETLSGCPAALILTFTPGTPLPSRDELLSKFSPYGDLMEQRTELVQDSASACVVFARSSDGEEAFHSSEKKTFFDFPLKGCRLRYLPGKIPSPLLKQPVKKPKTLKKPRESVKKSPLSNIKKSLAKMITSLTSSPSVDGSVIAPGWSNMEGMGELVDDMKALLAKVDGLIASPPAATPSGPLTSPPASTSPGILTGPPASTFPEPCKSDTAMVS